MLRWITNTWWKFVFFWKKRTGFVALGPVIATGTVLSMRTSKDGDALLNIELDEDSYWLTPLGLGHPSHRYRLHCEIVPWDQRPMAVHTTLQVGDRVKVAGDWGFDGVHLFDEKKRWLFPFEVLASLFRHQPNFKNGWFEIHPVTSIEKLQS